MNGIELPPGARVYTDSNIWIHHIEASPGWAAPVGHLLDAVDAVRARLVTSELTWAECVYKPAKDGATSTLSAFQALFANGGIELAALSGPLVLRAAQQGAGIGLKLLDAVHYLTALEAGCTHFATSDKGFRPGPALQVLTIAANSSTR